MDKKKLLLIFETKLFFDEMDKIIREANDQFFYRGHKWTYFKEHYFELKKNCVEAIR